MQKSWTGSEGSDLFVELGFDRGRRAGLEDGLRNAIRAGRLLAGTRLPSSRSLARDLGLARGTVVEAYEQLIAEGYLTARRGRGTSVAAGAHPAGVTARPLARPTRAAALVPGAPDLASFLAGGGSPPCGARWPRLLIEPWITAIPEACSSSERRSRATWAAHAASPPAPTGL